MYIRCAQCRSTIWFQAAGVGNVEVRVGCGGCNGSFVLDVERALGPDPGEQYRRASTYAETHGLDLPGAYSVLLGIMTVEQARVPAPAAQATPAPAAAAACAGEIALDVDEHFRPAIEQGHLTEAQARERGNREAWAGNLTLRHGLPIQHAYAVADGRITLRGAIAKHRAVEQRRVEIRRRRSLLSTSALVKAAGVTVGLAFVLMATAMMRAADPQSAPPTRPTVEVVGARDAGVVVQRDARERVVRIEGPDAESVVEAYCLQAAAEGRLRPIRVVETVPASPGLRLGLFRDTDDDGRAYELRIRKDRGSSRWIAGTGSQPIATTPVATAMPPGPGEV